MELNYRQVAVAFGVAVFLAAFRYVFSTVPKAIAIAGMVGGIAIVVRGSVVDPAFAARKREPAGILALSASRSKTPRNSTGNTFSSIRIQRERK